MNENNKTAIMCLFVREFHQRDKNIKVYNDQYNLLTENEYKNIFNSLASGISFFNPSFKGTENQAVKWIINNQLGPSVLGRSAFNKRVLDNEIKLGCKQYIVYASGYDTSALNYNIKSFEIDKSELIKDKLKRINKINNHINYIEEDLSKSTWTKKLIENGYDKNKKSHNSLLGICYYLTKDEFSNLLKNISDNISIGSTIVFDYQTLDKSIETTKNKMLANKANEIMKSKYSYEEIENILEQNNLRIYECLNDTDITNEFFDNYNILNPNYRIVAPKGVSFILAVKNN